MSKFLVTSALPYANGPLHFGHLSGAYIPADIYVRHRRLQGHKVMYISGSDEHGVAITLNAKKAGKKYQDYVNEWHANHKNLFTQYRVDFDFYGQTSADYHREEVLKWFKKLHEKGAIAPREESQLRCGDCLNFLPDRYVEGTCYKCGYEAARGDECPSCGTWIEPTKLINPICKICGSKNLTTTKVTQYYLLMSKYHEQFREWFSGKTHWRKSVVPYVSELSKESLHDRAITRDIDWGIDVPLPGCEGKKLYVWFDAPIGYVSNTKKYLETIGSKENYLKDWWKNDEVQISHFIGKDNIIFHAIVFPVMAMGTDFINPPTELPANQYVNLEGKQFSKSAGWYVDAEEAIKKFGPDALRYYLIHLIPETADTSFTWQGFAHKVNGELANNIGNFVNRSLKFFHKNWPAGLPAEAFAGFVASDAGKKLQKDITELHALLDTFQFRRGIEHLMAIGADANLFFSTQEPWKTVKEAPEKAQKTIAHSSLYAFVLGCLFAPFLPDLSKSILSYFGKKIGDKVVDNTYNNEFAEMEKFFSGGFSLTCEPAALVPKIDEKVIAALELELPRG